MMPFSLNRRWTLRLAAAALVLGAVSPAMAAWPDRNITVVVPFPPGGSTDTVARAVAQKLNEKLGQPVVIENRPGATGAIGTTSMLRAPADGYTFLVASIGVFATNPYLQPKLKYDPLNDFDLLTVAVRAPNVLVANPSYSANSVQELIAELKKNPGKVSFATSGAGSSDHLTAALFWQKTGTTGLHVPYRGGAPAVSDLIAGHVNVSFQNINAVISQIQGKQLKALAITGDVRSKALPDVPTLKELGIEGADVFSWQGVAAPKGLPADVKTRLQAEIVAALNQPDVRKRMEDVGLEIVANSPEQFRAFLTEELARWKQVIEVGGITPD
jgi:tripartite-type tricarboxylate transporter receptor subunit TctC